MHIGINGYYLTTANSGLGQYSSNLINALAEIDHTNIYYIFCPKKIELNLPANFKLKVISPIPFLKPSFLNRFYWEEYQLGQAIKQYKIDVFHGLYQSLPKGVENIGNVVTIHDAIPWRFPAERRQFSYRLYSDIRKELVTKRAKKVITVSETTKVDFAYIYKIKPETIEITYESIHPMFLETPTLSEISDFKKEFQLNNDFILYVGGLKRHKNLRMLIKSFAILVHEHGYKGNLVIIGEIRKTMVVSPNIYYQVCDLKRYAELKHVLNQVKFVDSVSQKHLSLFFRLAKCFVSVSLYEGFGLPAVEAMTSGCPSVLSNLGAYPEIAESAALFVYPYGPHRIANALNLLVSNKNIREQLKEKGLQRSKFFDRTKIAQRILEIYQEEYDDYKTNFQP